MTREISSRWLRALRRARRGSSTLVSVYFILFIVITMAGALLLGRVAVVHEQVQTAADSVATAAALSAERDGLTTAARTANYRPLWESQGVTLQQLDGPPNLHFAPDPNGRALEVTVDAKTKVNPTLGVVQDVGPLAVQASSRSRLPQQTISNVSRETLKMVLVLDYSGSMGANFGGGKTRMRALKDSVHSLLNLGLDLQYGLVMFSSSVLGTESVRDGNLGAIRNKVDSRDDGGGTNTKAAVSKAGELLRATDRKHRYMLVISDGAPNSGYEPEGVASSLRAHDNISIFTLSITTAGGNPVASNKRIAGPAGSGGNDPDYYFSASNENSLRDSIEEVLARILCKAGPIDPPPADPNGVYAFLRSTAGGLETRLDSVNDLGACNDHNRDCYMYLSGTHMVQFSNTICDKILAGSHNVVLRYDRPTLVR